MKLAAALLAALMMAGCYGPFGGHHVMPADYLTAAYAKWHVEVDYTADQKPADALLTFLHDRVAPLVNKPGGVDFRTDDALPAAQSSWSDDAILSYASQHSSFSTGNGEVVTHLMFLSGHSDHDTSDQKVLGITFDHDLIVIFPQTITSSCTIQNLCTSSDPMMRAATLHEFGHALGLVNRDVAMVHPHEDPNSPHHSTNPKSVMYYAVETSDIVALITNGGIPDSFDSNDKEDLHAAGGA